MILMICCCDKNCHVQCDRVTRMTIYVTMHRTNQPNAQLIHRYIVGTRVALS
jgi:hypothetical protein